MPNGDITLTSPKVINITGLQLSSLVVDLLGAVMQIVFSEVATGTVHVVRLSDASCVGFDYTSGVFTDGVPRAVTNEYTKLIGILFGSGGSGAGARKTAAVQALVTDGIITAAGTVA